MFVIRGVAAGLLALFLSGCMTTRTLQCVQDVNAGTMSCTELIDVVRK